jgi:hypothetical protein
MLHERFLGTGKLERPTVLLGIALAVTVTIVGADILLDVFGQIHAEARGGGGSTTDRRSP